MASAGLKRLAIPHHRLDGEGSRCAGESLTGRLLSWYDRQGRHVAGDFGVQVKRQHCLCHGTCFVWVCGVALLPEELSVPEERPRTHFPSDDVCPLVKKQRQVPVR